jgi:large subunit ribosomal protein L32
MGVPKWNITKSKRNQRRMHLHLKRVILAVCSKCGKPVLSHTVCHNCGYYKGVEIIDVLKKLTKKEKKQREKEMAAKEAGEKKTDKKSLSWEELSKK